MDGMDRAFGELEVFSDSGISKLGIRGEINPARLEVLLKVLGRGGDRRLGCKLAGISPRLLDKYLVVGERLVYEMGDGMDRELSVGELWMVDVYERVTRMEGLWEYRLVGAVDDVLGGEGGVREGKYAMEVLRRRNPGVWGGVSGKGRRGGDQRLLSGSDRGGIELDVGSVEILEGRDKIVQERMGGSNGS